MKPSRVPSKNGSSAATEKAPRLGAKEQTQAPASGRPREELNTTTSTNKPEENSTFGGVNVEGTEPEHVSLFTVGGRI